MFGEEEEEGGGRGGKGKDGEAEDGRLDRGISFSPLLLSLSSPHGPTN